MKRALTTICMVLAAVVSAATLVAHLGCALSAASMGAEIASMAIWSSACFVGLALISWPCKGRRALLVAASIIPSLVGYLWLFSTTTTRASWVIVAASQTFLAVLAVTLVGPLLSRLTAGATTGRISRD